MYVNICKRKYCLYIRGLKYTTYINCLTFLNFFLLKWAECDHKYPENNVSHYIVTTLHQKYKFMFFVGISDILFLMYCLIYVILFLLITDQKTFRCTECVCRYVNESEFEIHTDVHMLQHLDLCLLSIYNTPVIYLSKQSLGIHIMINIYFYFDFTILIWIHTVEELTIHNKMLLYIFKLMNILQTEILKPFSHILCCGLNITYYCNIMKV